MKRAGAALVRTITSNIIIIMQWKAVYFILEAYDLVWLILLVPL